MQASGQSSCRGFRHPKGIRTILLILAFHAFLAAAAADEKQGQGTLSGTVVDAEGAVVSGARARVNTWEGKLLAECVSDVNGRFRLGPLEAVYRHPFDVIVEADGFARQYVPSGTYSVFPNADSDLGLVRLDRGCAFTGHVLDHDGTPVADALVECVVDRHYRGNTVLPIGPSQTVRTDANGRFHTPPLSVGERQLLVRAPHRQVAGLTLPDVPRGEESLAPIRLERDVPIYGTITDSRGNPIVGAEIEANYDGDRTTSDTAGRFVLSGFGSNPRFQLQVKKDGYVFINWGVKGSDDGLRWHEVGGDPKDLGPVKQLDIVMSREAWIEGEAVDEATGLPVRLDQIVLCFFERKPDGEVVLNGCRASRFEQPQEGQFRVAYSTPGEFHLMFSAKGYHDAEAFTPQVETLAPIEGIRVKMRKKDLDSQPTIHRQIVSGTVTDHGLPVETGWIGLWAIRPTLEVVNAHIMRGRTVTGDPIVHASAPIRDGKYSLTVPFQGDAFYLVAESPARAPTQIGPVAVALGEQKSLDIEWIDGGEISGTVNGRPAEWEDDLWVVAFTDTAIRAEARVKRDGTFSLANLPPGRYGLKVGHDAYRDSEVPHHPNISADHWRTNADPWKRAKTVEVTAGQKRREILLELPAD